MNDYYLTLILNPDLEEKQRGEVLEAVKKNLTKEDGKFEKEDAWGNKDLAYQIRKKSKGYYVHFEFSADPKAARDLDKSLKLEEDIMRYLLVRANSKVKAQKSKAEDKKTKE